ncbi:MAG TPA: Hachiman antiphage defense system protein HamA [Gemmatimonadaceae bacterium]
MLDKWLNRSPRAEDTFVGFRVEDLVELEACTEEMKKHLAELMRKSAINYQFLAELAEHLEWPTTAGIVASRMPTQNNTKRGRFGEVVGVALLQELMNYVNPVEKGHFSITSDQSPPGTDAVLLMLDGQSAVVTEVCFVESKLRTVRDANAAVEGATQLATDQEQDLPDMLLFVAARLYERGDPLFQPFAKYLGSRSTEHADSSRLLLFYDSSVWQERVLENLRDAEPKLGRFGVVVTCLPNLRDLVAEVFSAAGMTVEDDDGS